MNQQIYRLSHWRVATEEINYRRFFDINSLGAVRMEHPTCLQETACNLSFGSSGKEASRVSGSTIPTGSTIPSQYFHRLQRGCFIQQTIASGVEPSPETERELAERYDEAVLADPAYKPFYIVGEKILTKSETMPEDWPIFSTTGYVFLNSVNGIFVDGQTQRPSTDLTRNSSVEGELSRTSSTKKRSWSCRSAMSSEINTLGHYLNDLSEKNRHTRDFTLNSLQRRSRRSLPLFPSTGRTPTPGVQRTGTGVIEQAVARAKRKNPALSE